MDDTSAMPRVFRLNQSDERNEWDGVASGERDLGFLIGLRFTLTPGEQCPGRPRLGGLCAKVEDDEAVVLEHAFEVPPQMSREP